MKIESKTVEPIITIALNLTEAQELLEAIEEVNEFEVKEIFKTFKHSLTEEIDELLGEIEFF